jgi:hypothetical protein
MTCVRGFPHGHDIREDAGNTHRIDALRDGDGPDAQRPLALNSCRPRARRLARPWVPG